MKDKMQPDHNRQKKIAVINDLTGFGRCSLAVSLPIISKLRVQCCPVPTAILSNHTAYPSYYMDDYTRHFTAYTSEWKKLGLRFSGILTGFMGSTEQIDLVLAFLSDFADPGTVVEVDPVMGDNGRRYTSCSDALCQKMCALVQKADIITPNLTESCLLTGIPYHEGTWHAKELRALLTKLTDLGPSHVVITGIPQGEFVASLSCVRGQEPRLTRQVRIGEQRYGTGDIFASIIAADAVNGVPFDQSVRKASRFVRRCIQKSIEMNLPNTDGVAFEEVLDTLH